MIYRMYLDDERWPKPDGKENWKIVRSFYDAVLCVQYEGLPYLISFDFDLGYNKKTGLDFAIWLVEWCKENGNPYFEFRTHSSSFEGRCDIEMVLAKYLFGEKCA